MTRGLNHGGAERTTSNISIDLEDLYDVHVVIFDGEDVEYPYGGKLHCLDLPPASTKAGKAIRPFQRARKWAKLKDELGIDCTISLLDGPNLVNIISGGCDRKIVSIRNNITMSQISSLEERLLRWYCDRADCVVSLSKEVEIDLENNHGVSHDKLLTIYNSCDGDRLRTLAAGNLDVITEYPFPYVVTMGRLSEQKGQWHLIRAFSLLASAHPELHLVILGEGDLRGKLEGLITKLGLYDRVHMPGFLKDPHDVISGAVCFCLPSLYEGLGSVVLEAIACGKAVVSTDCPSGPREILDEQVGAGIATRVERVKYGLLTPAFPRDDVDFTRIEPDDAERDLAAALELVISDEVLRHKLELGSLERADNFKPEVIKQDWINLIDSLCEEAK